MTRVMAFDDLWKNELVAVTVDGVAVMLVRIDDAVYAYANRCAHLGVALTEGVLDGRVLTCSAHHWQYDVVTGSGVNPKTACLARFSTKIVDGAIHVDVERK